MRNSFLALVLANLAFAAWQTWFDTAEPPSRVRTDLPTITLASEVATPASPATAPADTVTAAATDATARIEAGEPSNDGGAQQSVDALLDAAPTQDLAAADPVTSCVSVGPFRELAQAAGAAANLREGGYAPTQRAGEGDIWVGYWVYIDRIPSVAEANEIVATLRQNGVTDSYVIPESDSGTLVSLGVFTEIARAGGRREEARRLGHEPVISDRTRRGTVYWVDVALERSQSLDFELLQTPGRIIRLEQRPCELAPA